MSKGAKVHENSLSDELRMKGRMVTDNVSFSDERVASVLIPLSSPAVTVHVPHFANEGSIARSKLWTILIAVLCIVLILSSIISGIFFVSQRSFKRPPPATSLSWDNFGNDVSYHLRDWNDYFVDDVTQQPTP